MRGTYRRSEFKPIEPDSHSLSFQIDKFLNTLILPLYLIPRILPPYSQINYPHHSRLYTSAKHKYGGLKREFPNPSPPHHQRAVYRELSPEWDENVCHWCFPRVERCRWRINCRRQEIRAEYPKKTRFNYSGGFDVAFDKTANAFFSRGWPLDPWGSRVKRS